MLRTYLELSKKHQHELIHRTRYNIIRKKIGSNTHVRATTAGTSMYLFLHDMYVCCCSPIRYADYGMFLIPLLPNIVCTNHWLAASTAHPTPPHCRALSTTTKTAYISINARATASRRDHPKTTKKRLLFKGASMGILVRTNSGRTVVSRAAKNAGC